ncbi:hypothetical protein [Rhodanobacter denitrificans]|nr:hypothetical protein [Rhodanobacter denitrificans]UJM85293.1 hypothetical protein LRJ86_10935 [Rhodanobacter denitrificans]
MARHVFTGNAAQGHQQPVRGHRAAGESAGEADVLHAATEQPGRWQATEAMAMKKGLLFRPGSLWIGVHWSRHNRRFCINLIPCVTIWITLAGGNTP